MKKVTMYTGNPCSFCEAAKALLNGKSLLKLYVFKAIVSHSHLFKILRSGEDNTKKCYYLLREIAVIKKQVCYIKYYILIIVVVFYICVKNKYFLITKEKLWLTLQYNKY